MNPWLSSVRGKIGYIFNLLQLVGFPRGHGFSSHGQSTRIASHPIESRTNAHQKGSAGMADRWSTIAKPILAAIGELEGDVGPDVADLVAVTGINRTDVVNETRRLIQGDYVSAMDASSLAATDYQNLRLLPAGLTAVGSWPSNTASDGLQEAYNGLLKKLEEFIARAEPQERSKAEALREAAKSGTVKMGFALLAAWAKDKLGWGGGD